MTPDDLSGHDEIARWEAVEAEARAHQEEEARDAARATTEGEPVGPSAAWQEAPSWWDDPPAPGATEGAAPPVPDRPPADETPAEPPGVAVDVLLADADPAMAASIEQAMVDRGWGVRRVADGATALEELRRLPPHCFVLDYSLPVMAGPELLSRIAAEPDLADVRLVVNATQAQTLHVQQAKRLGAHRFMDRPRHSPDRLVAAVAEELVDLGLIDGADELASTTADSPTPVGAGGSGLFADAPPVPTRADDAPSVPTPSPAVDPAERVRRGFGSGGGPPGRIPRLG